MSTTVVHGDATRLPPFPLLGYLTELYGQPDDLAWLRERS